MTADNILSQLSSFLQTIVPAVFHPVWLAVAAVVGLLIGWLVRTGQVRQLTRDQQSLIDAHEDQMRSLQGKLQHVDSESLDMQRRAQREITQLYDKLEKLESMSEVDKSTLAKSASQLSQLQKERQMQAQDIQQLTGTITELRFKLDSDNESSRKYKALQTKYKQKQAGHRRELLELQSEIVKLKTTNLIASRQLKQLGGSLPDDNVGAARIEDDQNQQLEALMQVVEERESAITELENRMAEQRERHIQESDTLREQLQSRLATERQLTQNEQQLREKDEAIAALEQQLSDLNAREQDIEARAEARIADIEEREQLLQRKFKEANLEYQKDHQNLSTELKRLQSLDIANRNQARTISLLEQKLRTLGKDTEQLRERDAAVISLRAELETFQQKERSAQQQTRTLQAQFNELNDQNQQLRFENRKVTLLQQRLSEKEKSLSDLRASLRDNQALTERIAGLEQMVEEERQAKVTLSQRLNTARVTESRLLEERDNNPLIADLQQQLKTASLDMQTKTRDLEAQSDAIATLKTSADKATHLQEQLDHKQARIAGLIAEIEHYKSVTEDLARSEQACQQLQDECQVLKTHLEEQTQELDSHRELVNGQKQSIAQLNRTVSEFRGHANQAVEKLRLEKTRAESVTSAHQQLESRLASRNAEVNSLNAELARMDSLKQSLSSREASLSNAQNRLDELQRIVDDRDDTVRALTTRIEEHEQQREASSRQFSTAEDQFRQLSTEYTELKKTNAQLSRELETAQRTSLEAAATETLLQDATTQNDELQAQLDASTDKLDKLKAQLDTRTDEASRLTLQVQALESDLADQDIELNKLRPLQDQVQKLGKQQAAHKAEFDQATGDLTHQLRERDQKIAELHQQISRQFSEEHEHSQEAAGSNVELTRLNSEVESLKQERDLGLQRVGELSKQLKTLQGNSSQARQLKTQLTDQRLQERDLERLRKRIDRMDIELSHKNETIDELRRQIKRLKREQDRATGSAAHRSGSTAPNRKVPVTRPLERNIPAASPSANGATPPANGRVVEKTIDVDHFKDDLKLIRGIGPKLEKTLNQLGYTTIQQIAELDTDEVKKLSEQLDAFPGRIERDGWIESAKSLLLDLA